MNNKWYEHLTTMDHCTTLGSEIEGILNFQGEIMVDFDRDRDANLAHFELTGGAASAGLTVRDYFAAMSMQAFSWHRGKPIYLAQKAYEIADAMMEYRQFGNRLDQTSIEDLEFTARTHNALTAEGIHYVGELKEYTTKDLLKLPNIGITSLKEIQTALAHRGIVLPDVPITVEQAFGLTK